MEASQWTPSSSKRTKSFLSQADLKTPGGETSLNRRGGIDPEIGPPTKEILGRGTLLPGFDPAKVEGTTPQIGRGTQIEAASIGLEADQLRGGGMIRAISTDEPVSTTRPARLTRGSKRSKRLNSR